MKDTTKEQSLKIGSLNDPEYVREATKIVMNNGVIVAQMFGVFGIWGRGDSPAAVKKISAAKGESQAPRTLSTMMSSEQFLQLIDPQFVDPKLRKIISNPMTFKEIFGAMYFARARMTTAGAKSVTSVAPAIVGHEDEKDYLHNLDPYGHPPMEDFIKTLFGMGAKYVAVTSANKSGEPEITNLRSATEFSNSASIPIVLADPLHKRVNAIGSFAIHNLETNKGVREGNFPLSLLYKMLGNDWKEIASDDTIKKSKHPQALIRDLQILLDLDLDPRKIRDYSLGYITGSIDLEEIRQLVP